MVPQHVSSASDVAEARDLVDNYVKKLCRTMVSRSRFDVVTMGLCEQLVPLLLKPGTPTKHMTELATHTGFWDPYFLVLYCKCLLRWAYFELQEELLT